MNELLLPFHDLVMWHGTVEVSGKKPKKRIVAVGSFSLGLADEKGRAIALLHYLDMQEINHPDPNTCVISLRSKEPLGLSGEQCRPLVHTLLVAYHNVFFGLPPAMQLSKRVRPDLLPPLATRPVKRMDGFSDLYRAFCAHAAQRLPPRLDITWDVDNIMALNHETVFDPREFESPLDPKDLMAMFRSLSFNRCFMRLHMKKARLDRDSAIAAAEVFQHNSEIRVLCVTECAPHTSLMMAPLAAAMSSNLSIALSVLMLSNNGLDDKDLTQLSNGIGAMPHGLVELDLSLNVFTKKGFLSLMSAFTKNTRIAQTLLRLSLNGCKIGTEGSSSLGSWLAVPNQLQELLVSDTNATVQHIAGGLSRGSVDLCVLDISHNKFLKAPIANLAGFFAVATKLTRVSMASTVPQPQQLKELLRALISNSALDALHLDLSDNALGVVGANLLALELGGTKVLVALAAAGNGFGDKGLSILVEAALNCRNLVKLDLSDNFDYAAFRKSKAPTSLFVDAMGELLAQPGCKLAELRLVSTERTTQLRLEMIPLLMDMAPNQSLTSLDISGQSLEYSGCVAVAKMLQINKKLSRLVIDDNGMDLSAMRALQQGIIRNSTLTEVPLPINDMAVQLAKTDALGRKEIGAVWSSIEETLHNNRRPKIALPVDAIGRGAGASVGAVLIADEQLERLRNTVRELVTQRGVSLSPEQKALLQDVDNTEQAGMALSALRSRLLVNASGAVSAQLEQALPQVMRPLQQATEQLHADAMDVVRAHFRSVHQSDSRILACMEHAKKEKSLAVGEVQQPLVQAAGGEIVAMLDDVFMAQLAAATDAVHEALVEKLQMLIFQMGSSSRMPTSPRATAASVGELQSSSGAVPAVVPAPRESPSKHSRSKSGGSGSALRQSGKSAGALLAASQGDDAQQSLLLQQQQMLQSVNALVSPRKDPMASSGAIVDESAAKPRRQSVRTKVVKRVVRRRPKGPQAEGGESSTTPPPDAAKQ